MLRAVINPKLKILQRIFVNHSEFFRNFFFPFPLLESEILTDLSLSLVRVQFFLVTEGSKNGPLLNLPDFLHTIHVEFNIPFDYDSIRECKNT